MRQWTKIQEMLRSINKQSPVCRQKLAGRGAAVLSGLLLWAAYPPLEQPHVAWIALAPLLLSVRYAQDAREAFRVGMLSGLTFWGSTLFWLWRLVFNSGPWPLVAAGHLGLSFYCALYTGLFALGLKRFLDHAESDRGAAKRLILMVAVPLMWVGGEFLRSTLFSGFAWNTLGVSQYRALPLVQLSRWGGVYLLSALIVVANGALAGLLERMWLRLRRQAAGWQPDLPLAMLLVAWSWFSGMHAIRRCRTESDRLPTVVVAAVQPNAPCIFERDTESVASSLRVLRRQTENAAVVRPDLVVWPETALPGTLPQDVASFAMVSELSQSIRTPILTGVLEVLRGDADGAATSRERIYNAAWLFDADGRVRDRYHKQHLVPFGEFIPMAARFPVLNRLSPIGYSCTAGDSPGVMTLPAKSLDGRSFAFAPLICFEDTVAHLARRAVRAGAQLLINQTNDAWFDGSAEPRQHLAQSVFRSVETRTPMVRAANTGVSAFVDRCGRVTELVDNGRKDGFAGFLIAAAAISDAPPDNLYFQYGDWILGIPAALWFGAVLVYDYRLRKRFV